MLPGVSVHEINKLIDERGFLAEILREDWKDVMGDDKIAQANLSFSYPGTIRAWHRHNRGQVDRLIVLQGSMKICAYDDKKGSATQGSLEEIKIGRASCRERVENKVVGGQIKKKIEKST